MDHISLLAISIPALPLAATIVTALAGPRLLRQYSHYPAVLAIFASFICSLLLLQAMHFDRRARQDQGGPLLPAAAGAGYERIVPLWTWAGVEAAYEQPALAAGPERDSPAAGGGRDFRVQIALRVDSLTVMMLAMVTFVSTLVTIFAAGYMHGDHGYWRFFTYLALFVFSMTMLVSVSNFVLLYVFWEAVGVCSYLLIGFWYDKPEAAAAGKKAFLVNRVGDFGFAVALFLIWTTYGTLNFHDTLADGSADHQAVAAAMTAPLAADAQEAASPPVVRGVLGVWRMAGNDYVGGGVGLAICLLLLLGACGKSAQFPLHVWLPDAMEGPTPVSALIHAATMVTAGVYLVARCTPLFLVSPEAQLVVACVGALTALLAGLIALTQFDLKRVLAYSTISQLGYMFLGLGTGTFAGITAGMFHLFTHAFFKALLFLGAGSVMHAMGNVIDMRRFGGLRRRLPITHWTFLVGCLALAGLPLFSGFWSKDSIVAAVHEKAHQLRHAGEHGGEGDEPPEGHVDAAKQPRRAPRAAAVYTALRAGFQADEHGGAATPRGAARQRQFAAVYQGLYYVALFTALVTAFYTFRAFFLTFYGPEKIPAEAGHHAHESPPVMYWPLIVLAVGAALAGWWFDATYRAVEPTHTFSEFLAQTPVLAAAAPAVREYKFHWPEAIFSGLIAGGGLLLATYLYVSRRRGAGWLKAVFDWQRLSRWFDVETAMAWRSFGWVRAVQRGANAVWLGWLASLLGGLVLLGALMLTALLLLAGFLSPRRLSQRKFFFDEIYQATIVFPLRVLAAACYALDRVVVDGLVNATGRVPPAIGALLRPLQLGLVQFYALAMVLGVLVLLAALTPVLLQSVFAFLAVVLVVVVVLAVGVKIGSVLARRKTDRAGRRWT